MKEATGTSSKAKMKTKSQTWESNTTLYILFLVIIGLVVSGSMAAFLLSTTPLNPMTSFYHCVFLGMIAAVIARRRGKSGWVWFFVGLIPIGFSVVFLLAFLKALLFHH